MIFKSSKEIPLGTIIKKGYMGLNGILDINGKLHKDAVVRVLSESTKEDFLRQFEESDIKINQCTLEDINDENTKFYYCLHD